jgi:hypothetical protein
MAGDWIKMRADLFTHPKVVRMASALKADRLRTVGGLMSAWCLFDAHSIDGSLDGYTSETLDEHLGWSGFSEAMKSVGWLADDGESLALPSFDTHNGASAKRRAMDADRKRTVRNVSASEADKKRTREEKRREEKKEQKKGAAAPDLFHGVNPQVVADFSKLRAAKKAAITPTAVEGIKREAGKAGLSLEAAMAMCCERGWTGFKAAWVTEGGALAPSRQRVDL